MHLNVETLSLINGGDALLLALMLWFGTRIGSNHAVQGLRLRATALLIEAVGDFILEFDFKLSSLTVLLVGNTFNLTALALTIVALRMVLQRKLRWREALALGAAAWLGVTFLATVDQR